MDGSDDAAIVRTVTCFCGLDGSVGDVALIESAAQIAVGVGAALAQKGFVVQTTRVATNPWEQYTSVESSIERIKELSDAAQASAKSTGWPDDGITSRPPLLLSIGPATSVEGIGHLQDLLVALPSVTSSAAIPTTPSVLTPDRGSSAWPLPSSGHAIAAAKLVKKLAGTGDGSLNFNFSASFNVPKFVPFFPVAKHGGPDGGLALGLGLQLVGVLAASAARHCSKEGVDNKPRGDEEASVGVSAVDEPEGVLLGDTGKSVERLERVRADVAEQVLRVQRAALTALAEVQAGTSSDSKPVPPRSAEDVGAVAAGGGGGGGGGGGASQPGSASEERAQASAADSSPSSRHITECRYVGVDTSLAPAPDAPSIGSIFARLGVPSVFGAGSVAASSLVTWMLRSLPTEVKTTGYCGLMLPPLEDTSLAAWTSGSGDASRCPAQLHSLLLCSSVCGIGLDTVPVPDNVSVAAVARLLLDVGALSARLGGKPLSCRLFPVPGSSKAGDAASFPTNPYLCDGAALPLA